MKKLLLFFVTVCSGSVFNPITSAEPPYDESVSVTTDDTMVGEQAKGGCRCYCSALCGVRDAKPADKPFFDEEFNKCFCAPRDKDIYLENQCHREEQKEPTTCCGKQ